MNKYFPTNYTMLGMCVTFTLQEDRNILHAIGQLVSFNQLLFSTTNQRPYAATSTLYKETSFLVTSLALLLSSCEKSFSSLVPKPILHLKLDKQFSSELYHGTVNFRCKDGSHFSRHGRQPSGRSHQKDHVTATVQ